MRLTVAVVCLTFGLAFPALLNGQTFTNSVIGIACACSAIALALGPAREGQAPKSTRRWGPVVVVVLGVMLAASLTAQLPAAYRFQAGFNRRLQDLRQHHP